MAKRVITEVKTILEQEDRDLIYKEIGSLIIDRAKEALRFAEQNKWDEIGIGFADAGDWVLILGSIQDGSISTLEELKEKINRMDTQPREYWYDVIDSIEDSVRD